MNALGALRLYVLAAVLPFPSPAPAQMQQILPVLWRAPNSSTPVEKSVPFTLEHYNGAVYVALGDIATALNGTIRHKPLAHSAELRMRGQKISFVWNSSYAHVGERRFRLDHPVVRNDAGVWVPLSFWSQADLYRMTGYKIETETSQTPKTEPAPTKPSPAAPVEQAKSLSTTPAPEVVKPVPAVSAPMPHSATARALRRIVIDPGHGGKDPGTVGAHGVEEKAMNLLLAQQLAETLREQFDYEVILTRTDDTFIPLAERARIANHYNADLFISIHCNASISSQLRGFEVYFLSETASDAHADAVARAENSALELEDSAAAKTGPLKALLRSMVKNANINESSAVGALIDHHVSRRLKIPSLGVKQAGFYVLRGADMPAVLVESGFLSNAKEEKLLQDPEFRSQLVSGLAAAVDAYDQRKQRERPAHS